VTSELSACGGVTAALREMDVMWTFDRYDLMLAVAAGVFVFLAVSLAFI